MYAYLPERKPYVILLAFLTLFMQGFAGSQAEQDPAATEAWEPVPKLVTPGNERKPPSDAVVLFDGTDLSAWEREDSGVAEWRVENGAMTVNGTGNIQTKESFGDVQLHLEWRTPSQAEGEGQERGNSGVFLQKRYEVQVLDSYDNRTYSNGQAGSLYKQYIPQVNASKGPGEWQTYDIIFNAPQFNADGSVDTPARVTVFHNGVLIQNSVELKGPTVYVGEPFYTAHPIEQPLMLQDHGDAVSYKNIWLREIIARQEARY
jgi:hypothetical protein